MEKKIFLVDASSLFFRSFYGIRRLSTPSGFPTQAIYGVLSMLFKLLKEEHRVEYMVFCYDRKEPSFRKDLYKEYKAHRDEMPEELALQFPHLKRIPILMGIPTLEVPSFEADDLLCTLALKAEAKGFDVFIVSGDKDFGQIISDHIALYDSMKKVKMFRPEVKEKWGVYPEQFIDYLALVGDTSDNIPGVKGIGPKGAQALINEYGNLENIYQNINKIASKSTREKLEQNKESAFLSKRLVTLVRDVPISDDMMDYKLHPPDKLGMISFFEEFNFKSMTEVLEQYILRMQKNDQAQIDRSHIHELQVNDLSTEGLHTEGLQVDERKIEEHQEEHQIAEFESKDLKELQDKAELWGLLLKDQVYICIIKNQNLEIRKISGFKTDLSNETGNPSNETGNPSNGTGNSFDGTGNSFDKFRTERNLLMESFAKKQIRWKGFYLKSIWHKINSFSEVEGFHHQGVFLKMKNPFCAWDNQLASYLLHAGESMSLSAVMQRYKMEERIGISLNSNDLESPSPSFSVIQKLFEAQIQLESILSEKLKSENVFSFLTEIELPLTTVLYEMESVGIYLDKSKVDQLSLETGKEIEDLIKEIHRLSGTEFNVASTKQLAQVLFEKMGLPRGKKIKTGYSTDIDVLEKLKGVHPIIEKLLQFRELTKLKSTYMDSLTDLIKSDGRIHTTFQQSVTATGRLSSTDPNLQNIPIRTPRGAQIRTFFAAAEGKKLLSVDYSQIELRILAHFSEDPNLQMAFFHDVDIHTLTASQVFSVPVEHVTSEMRRTAKAVNFGIAYGQGAFGLSENLGISRAESQKIIDRYFSQFLQVQRYIESTIKKAESLGYVETLWGRRRYINDIRSRNQTMKKMAERAAINAPIQGTASDLVKKAMVQVHYAFLQSAQQRNDHVEPPQMLLQVHDELVFEGTPESITHWRVPIAKIMENIVALKVPLKVQSSIGKTWGDAH